MLWSQARRPGLACTHHECLMPTWIFQALSTLSPCLTVQFSSASSAEWLTAPGDGCPAGGGFWSITCQGQLCPASPRPSEVEEVILVDTTAVRFVPVGGRQALGVVDVLC